MGRFALRGPVRGLRRRAARAFFPGFLPALACVLAFGIVAGRLPLLSVLGYETSAAAAVVLFACAAAWGIGAARATGPPRIGPLREVRGTAWTDLNARLGLRLRGGLLLAAVPVATCLARQVSGQGCAVHTGLPLYLVLAVPSLALGLAAGAAAGGVARGRRCAASVLVVLFFFAAAGMSLAEAYFGPRAVPHNLVIGEVSLSGYTGADGGLAVSGTLARQRAFTTLLAVLLWAGAGYLIARRQSRLPPEDDRLRRETLRSRRRFGLALCAALLLGVPFLLAPGASGLGTGSGRVMGVLSRTEETAHVRLHYHPGGPGERLARRVALGAEWWVRELSGRLGIDPCRVEIWLYDGPEQQAALTGARGFLYAQPWRGALHVQVRDGRVPNLDHELVHVLAGQFGPPPFDASWLPGLTEGLATALQYRMDLEPAAHAQAAAALRAGYLPHARELLGTVGFGGSAMRRSYASAGSFCGWLLRAYGAARMRRAYRSGDVEAAFGASLAELDSGWRAFLGTVPFDEADREKARPRFDPAVNPPFYATPCPRVGRFRADDPLAARAREIQRAGDREAAAEAWAAYGTLDPLRRGGALLWAGRVWTEEGDPRGPPLLRLLASRDASAVPAAWRSLFRLGLRRGDERLALDALGRTGEADAETLPLLEERAAGAREGRGLRGTGRPTAAELVWLLFPFGDRPLPLPVEREAVERLAETGRAPAASRRGLKSLAVREARAGLASQAHRHLDAFLRLDPDPAQAGEVRDALRLLSFVEAGMSRGKEEVE